MSTALFSANDPRPIGVFDSGVGGLTVLRSLMAAMPGENFLYLGDTARVPYGTKNSDTIKAYSTGLARVLLGHDVKMIVIACNTASAHATEIVQQMAASIPVIGMIGPAAQAAARSTKNKNILVMGTQSTIRSACYQNALHAIDPSITVQSVATQLLVALAEEGWTSGPIVHDVVRKYIGPVFSHSLRPDTVILGCTHFPLLREAIAEIAGKDVTLIDNGDSIVRLLGGGGVHTPSAQISFMVTDSPARFTPLAEIFLGTKILPEQVSHIDVTDFDNPVLTRHSASVIAK